MRFCLSCARVGFLGAARGTHTSLLREKRKEQKPNMAERRNARQGKLASFFLSFCNFSFVARGRDGSVRWLEHGSQVEDQTYNWGGRAGGQHIWGVGEVGEGVDRVASWDIQLRWSDTAGSRKHGAAGYAHCAIVLQWQRRDSLRSFRGAAEVARAAWNPETTEDETFFGDMRTDHDSIQDKAAAARCTTLFCC